MSQMIYLASPYTHDDAAIRNLRYQQAKRAVILLMKIRKDVTVFSPIVYAHPLVMGNEIESNFDYWSDFDIEILNICDSIIVLKLVGWKHSKGVSLEVIAAKKQGIPIVYMSPLGETSEPIPGLTYRIADGSPFVSGIYAATFQYLDKNSNSQVFSVGNFCNIVLVPGRKFIECE